VPNIEKLKLILSMQLGGGYSPSYFSADVPLLGAIPELDSMAVAGILTAIEDELGISIPDDELDAEAFSTFGTLCGLVQKYEETT